MSDWENQFKLTAIKSNHRLYSSYQINHELKGEDVIWLTVSFIVCILYMFCQVWPSGTDAFIDLLYTRVPHRRICV